MTFIYFTNQQIIPFIISAVILIGSVLFFTAEKQKISLILLFIGALGLGFFMANLDPFLVMWDEQYHALVAKHMAENPLHPTLFSIPLLEYDYGNWSGNYTWLHKQPLFLWQIALSLKLFGLNTIAVRLPSILLHAIASLMIFRIGKISNSERVGFYGALFFTVAYYPLELVAGRYATDHNDIAFLFYVTASFWAWFEYQNSGNKYYLIFIGLFSGCAVLVKWMVGLLIYMVWVITLGRGDKRNWIRLKSYYPLLICFSITLLVFLPWQLYILFKFPLESGYEFALNTKHFFEPLEGHEGGIWFHLKALKTIYGSGEAVPYLYLLGVIFLIYKSKANIYRWAIASAIIITYVFYSLASTKMTSFCIIVLPFAMLGIGSLIDSAFTFLNTKIKSQKFDLFFRPIVIILICGFMVDMTKVQNYHTDWKPNDNCNRKAEFTQLSFIKNLTARLGTEKYVVFNANARWNGHIEVMFFTDYIAYDLIPNEHQIERIKSSAYKIAILDNDTLPGYITADNEIMKIKP